MKTLLHLGAGLMLIAATAAQAGPIRETITGVVGGKHTRDMQGYFGTRGAELRGKPFAVVLLYRPLDFNRSGRCRNNACDYDVSSGTAKVTNSVSISLTIGGVTQTYAPTTTAALFFSTSGTPFFAIDSDAYSGFGGYGPHGVQLYVEVMSNPAFGAALSPTDPVLHHKTKTDNVLFFDNSSQTATEELDLNVSRSAR